MKMFISVFLLLPLIFGFTHFPFQDGYTEQTVAIYTTPKEIYALNFTDLWGFFFGEHYHDSYLRHEPIIINSPSELPSKSQQGDIVLDEDFFAKYYIVMLNFIEESGSFRLSVDGVYSNGHIYITRQIPEFGTDDIAHWQFNLAIERGIVPKQFTPVFTNITIGW
jgi:hypothetical protein